MNLCLARDMCLQCSHDKRVDYNILPVNDLRLSETKYGRKSKEKSLARTLGFSLISLLLQLYAFEGNYYAKYFCWVSG
jgi:hypothetical protein